MVGIYIYIARNTVVFEKHFSIRRTVSIFADVPSHEIVIHNAKYRRRSNTQSFSDRPDSESRIQL